MEGTSQSKVILVSGSNRGLGLELVKECLETGYTAILCSRDAVRGEEVKQTLAASLPERKDNLFFCALDISDNSSVTACAEWVKEKFGQIDILFNNAATACGENEIALKWIEAN